MSECARKGKWFGGCRFEARYDLGAPDMTKTFVRGGYASDLPGIIEIAKPKTYIHDICVRCGKIVEPTVTITNELSTTSTPQG